MPEEKTVFDILKKIDGMDVQKVTLTPAEQVAFIALRPFLEMIGARMLLMIDQAIEKTKEEERCKKNKQSKH